jgi:hypothetical protein
MPQCHATNRAGKQCKQHARVGQKVCRMHGGNTPQALRNAGKRSMLDEIEERIARRMKPQVDQARAEWRTKVNEIEVALEAWLEETNASPIEREYAHAAMRRVVNNHCALLAAQQRLKDQHAQAE